MKYAAAGLLLIAVAGVAVEVAGSTGSNSLPSSSLVGYGTTGVSGATVNNISYTVDSTGSTITGATVTLATNVTGAVVGLAFNGGTPTNCTVSSAWNGSVMTETCSLNQSVATANTVSVVVH